MRLLSRHCPSAEVGARGCWGGLAGAGESLVGIVGYLEVTHIKGLIKVMELGVVFFKQVDEEGTRDFFFLESVFLIVILISISSVDISLSVYVEKTAENMYICGHISFSESNPKHV